jgi:hypothetical protein
LIYRRTGVIDCQGKVQESSSLIGKLFGRTFPDGAKGYHSIDISAVKEE